MSKHSKNKKDDPVAALLERINSLETNLSLVSSRLIRIELEGKELRKTVENIPKYVPPPEKVEIDKSTHFYEPFYYTETIPPSEEEGYGFYVRDDSSFFAFSLKGNSPKPIMFKKKDNIYSLKVYSHDNDQWLIGTHCGFYIGTTKNSFISNKFNAFYDCTLSPDLFTGSYFPTTFSVNRVLALRWE
ncbi:TLDc domain-containing protein [Entamoeba marina]